MSVAKSSLFTGARGSFGNIIIYEVAGQIRFREKTGKYKKSKSPKQAAQKSKFKEAARLYHEIESPMFYTWTEATRGTSLNGYNLFIKTNIRNMTAEGEIADLSAFKICCGPLTVPDEFRMTVIGPKTIRVSWKEERPLRTDGSDLLQMALYDPSQSRRKFKESQIYWLEEVVARRNDGQCEFTLPDQVGGRSAFVCFF